MDYVWIYNIIRSYLKKRGRKNAGHFPESVIIAAVHPPPLRLPCSCSSTKWTNERLATAFPLIVISLSQGELSRDQARTEQFSSPPIPAATVFLRRSRWIDEKQQKVTDRPTRSQSDRRAWKAWEKSLASAVLSTSTLGLIKRFPLYKKGGLYTIQQCELLHFNFW